MVVAVVVLGAACGILAGALIGLWFLHMYQQADLQSVRRRYFGVYEELQEERKLSRQLATGHAETISRLAERDRDGLTNLVGVLGDKFADLVHGFPVGVPDNGESVADGARNPVMGDIGLDNTAGAQHKRTEWYPEWENDPWLEPQDRPPERDDEVVAWEMNPTQGTPNGNSPNYVRTPSGPMRTDGQPLFRSGQSAAPPQPGVE